MMITLMGQRELTDHDRYLETRKTGMEPFEEWVGAVFFGLNMLRCEWEAYRQYKREKDETVCRTRSDSNSIRADAKA